MQPGKLVLTIATRWLCCYGLILQCLFYLPPHPHKQFFLLFHLTMQTCINLHHLKMRFSLSLQLVPSATTSLPPPFHFWIYYPHTVSLEFVLCGMPAWFIYPSLTILSTVITVYQLWLLTSYLLSLAPHFYPQTSLWKVNKSIILQSMSAEFPQSRHIPNYSHILKLLSDLLVCHNHIPFPGLTKAILP